MPMLMLRLWWSRNILLSRHVFLSDIFNACVTDCANLLKLRVAGKPRSFETFGLSQEPLKSGDWVMCLQDPNGTKTIVGETCFQDQIL